MDASPQSFQPHLDELISFGSSDARTEDLLAATPRLERCAPQAPSRTAVLLPPSLEFLPISEIAGRSERFRRRRMHTLQPGHRVAVLERRDIEKRSRLERLEKAMARVERVRALVRPSS